ncbi:hypothetical protein [Paenibacillus sp. IITD108]
MQEEEIILEIQKTSKPIKTMEDLHMVVQAVGDIEIVMQGAQSTAWTSGN